MTRSTFLLGCQLFLVTASWLLLERPLPRPLSFHFYFCHTLFALPHPFLLSLCAAFEGSDCVQMPECFLSWWSPRDSLLIAHLTPVTSPVEGPVPLHLVSRKSPPPPLVFPGAVCHSLGWPVDIPDSRPRLSLSSSWPLVILLAPLSSSWPPSLVWWLHL